MEFTIGQRVEFVASVGTAIGYVTDIYDYHGAVKLRIRSNGKTFCRLPSEVHNAS